MNSAAFSLSAANLWGSLLGTKDKKTISWQNHRFKESFTTKEKEKLSNRLTAAILKDLRLEIEQCSKYQLIFVTANEVLSRPFLFWLKKIKKKRKLPYRFTLLHVISTVISINVRSLLFSVIDSCQKETKSQQKQKTDGPVQTSRRDLWLAKQIQTSVYL